MKNYWLKRKKFADLASRVLKTLNINPTDDYIEEMVKIAEANSSKGMIAIGQKMAYHALVRYAICTKKSRSSIWKA